MSRLKVISSSPGRTASKSMQAALEILGMRTYHMTEVMMNTRDQEAWMRYFSHHRVEDVLPVLEDFDAVVDFPTTLVWKELAARNPNALIVHQVRDTSRWIDSVYETIFSATAATATLGGYLRSSGIRFVTLLLAPLLPSMRIRGRWMLSIDALWRDFFFDGVPVRKVDAELLDFSTGVGREHAAAVYEAWQADVVASVEPSRLLLFNPRDGWKPLCAFLGVPEPSVPFPNVNDRKEMLKRLSIARTVTSVFTALLLAVVAVGCYSLLRLALTFI